MPKKILQPLDHMGQDGFDTIVKIMREREASPLRGRQIVELLKQANDTLDMAAPLGTFFLALDELLNYPEMTRVAIVRHLEMEWPAPVRAKAEVANAR